MMEGIEEEESRDEQVLGSSLTMEKVAAAKQYIENHYRAQMKTIQERKERYGDELIVRRFLFLSSSICLVTEKIGEFLDP